MGLNKKVKIDIFHSPNKHFLIEAITERCPNTKTTFLLDTGAHRNFLKASLLSQLKIKSKDIDKADIIPVIGVSNTQVMSIGSVWVKLCIEGVTFPIKFHLLENLLAAPAIIGAEFLKTHTTFVGNHFEYMIWQRFPDVTVEYEKEHSPTLSDDFTQYDESFTGIVNETVSQEEWEENLLDELLDLEKNTDCDFIEYKNTEPIEGHERLQELAKLIDLSHLHPENFAGVRDIIIKHKDIFFLAGDRLSTTYAAKHEIETTTNVPINKRQYRFPEATKSHINEEIEEMLKQGIIKPSTSPWNAPVLCVPKKPDPNGNKRYRIVVDFRALNTITKSFIYPIPLINEILDNIGESSYFSSLDLKSGFYQVPIDPRDAQKTAFSTPRGHFEFTRMPMGLKNSPSTFQRLMNSIIYEIGDVQAFVYLDDIIIFGKNAKEHNHHLKKVLNALRKHNLKIEPGKCQFLKNEIQYLGHIISKEGIKPTNANIKVIQGLKPPKTIKEVRSFLGTVNFYGKFIPDIAGKRKPLNDLLKKNVKFVWSDDCQRAFEELKESLISEPLLVRPNYKDTFVLTTDASDYAVGTVLSNEKTIDRPIAYASRALKDSEKRYHTIEKELLAIVWAIEYFRHYIFNQKFIIYTDHRPLIAIDRLKETSPILTRLRLKLIGIECDIRYKQGRENIVADFLSRINTPEQEEIQAAVTTRAKNKKNEEGKDKEVISADQSRLTPPNDSDENNPLTILPYVNNDIRETENKAKEDLYSCFEYAVTNYAFMDTNITPSDNFFTQEDCDGRFVIANSKNLHNELSELCKLPHGSRQFAREKVINIPENKLWGIVVHGNSRALIESRKFFDLFVTHFLECFKNFKINSKIQIIAFRQIRQPEILQMIEFVAWKLNMNIHLYNANAERINVSPDEVETVLREFHDAPLGGHIGAKRMRKRVGLVYHWKNMRRDIENYVRQCDSCQRNKIGKSNKIPMKITSTASEPFEKIYMDIVVLPESECGNKYGLTVQDDLTRYLNIIPIANQESVTIARAFVENIICKFGTPLEVVTDRGTNFMSNLMKEVCKLLKIKKICTNAYHPQANLVERSNRELKTYLRQFVCNRPKMWDQQIPYFLFEYNTAFNSSTGFSPYELIFGRSPRIPASIYVVKEGMTYNEYVLEMKKIFADIHTKALENLAVSKTKSKQIYDESANEWQPMWGEKVYVHNVPTGTGQKLQSYWRGPYEVVELKSEQTTVLKNGNKLEEVHNNRLKRYVD